jgi:hypothetical protein
MLRPPTELIYNNKVQLLFSHIENESQDQIRWNSIQVCQGMTWYQTSDGSL